MKMILSESKIRRIIKEELRYELMLFEAAVRVILDGSVCDNVHELQLWSDI